MTHHQSKARYWRRIGAAATMLLLPALAAAQPEITLGNIRIEPDPSGNERMRILVEAEVEGFLTAVDQQISAALTHSCSRRPYRAGGTRILTAGDDLWLSTPVRYEQWVCAFFKTRLFRTTFDTEWSIRVNSPAKLDNLRLTAGFENAQGIPGEVEQWFDLEERLRATIDIPVPTDCGPCRCADLVEALDPIVEAFNFEDRGGGNLLVKAEFFTSNDVTRLVQCASR